MTEPANCPWCTNAVKVRCPDGWARVECDACGACGPVHGDEETPLEERKQSAVEDWNQVAAPKKRRSKG